MGCRRALLLRLHAPTEDFEHLPRWRKLDVECVYSPRDFGLLNPIRKAFGGNELVRDGNLAYR